MNSINTNAFRESSMRPRSAFLFLSMACLFNMTVCIYGVGGQLHSLNPKAHIELVSIELRDPIHADSSKLVELSLGLVKAYPANLPVTNLALARFATGGVADPANLQIPHAAGGGHFQYTTDVNAGHRVIRAEGEVTASTGTNSKAGLHICDVMFLPVLPQPGGYDDQDFTRNRHKWESGHIIGADLGGSNTAQLNYMPQHEKSNGASGRWNRMERIAREVKDLCPGSSVGIIIDINYPAYLTPERFRPTGGRYTIRILEALGPGTCRQALFDACNPNPASATLHCIFFRQAVEKAINGQDMTSRFPTPIVAPGTPFYLLPPVAGTTHFQMTREWINSANDVLQHDPTPPNNRDSLLFY